MNVSCQMDPTMGPGWKQHNDLSKYFNSIASIQNQKARRQAKLTAPKEDQFA